MAASVSVPLVTLLSTTVTPGLVIDAASKELRQRVTVQVAVAFLAYRHAQVHTPAHRCIYSHIFQMDTSIVWFRVVPVDEIPQHMPRPSVTS